MDYGNNHYASFILIVHLYKCMDTAKQYTVDSLL